MVVLTVDFAGFHYDVNCDANYAHDAANDVQCGEMVTVESVCQREYGDFLKEEEKTKKRLRK